MKELIIKVDDEKMDIEGNAPVVDRPQELVRCKDCKHYVHVRTDAIGHCTKDISCWVFRDMDWFCADGERK